MNDTYWSSKEKRVARAAFEKAAIAEEQELIAQCKSKATDARNIDDLIAIERWIRDSQREYQQKYDFRYSQLLFVFARLLREGRITMNELEGFNEEKLQFLRKLLSL